jgi:hypothetical protein
MAGHAGRIMHRISALERPRNRLDPQSSKRYADYEVHLITSCDIHSSEVARIYSTGSTQYVSVGKKEVTQTRSVGLSFDTVNQQPR